MYKGFSPKGTNEEDPWELGILEENGEEARESSRFAPNKNYFNWINDFEQKSIRD